MEDKIISLTPAVAQITIWLWFAYDIFRDDQHTHRPLDLVLFLILLAFFPFLLLRLRTAWRDRHFSDPPTVLPISKY